MPISECKIEKRKMQQARILTGALAAFKSRGLDNATMEEIASESGLGKATLYYYFRSKEEVFSAILENGWQMLWLSLEPVIAADTTPRKTFIQMLLKIVENIRNRPELFKFLFDAPKIISFKEEPWKKYQNHMYITLNTLLEEGIKAGEFPDINPKLLFKAMGGLFMGLVLMGEKKEIISEKDIEKLLTQLIRNPMIK